MLSNPFYVLAGLLLVGALLFGRNNKYAATACVLVAALSGFVGTYYHGE